jgi:glycylpeptide N-tetradecanoyltransferase
MEKHTFWDKQPVKREDIESVGVINKNTLKISKEQPTPLPTLLSWCNFDISDETEFNEFHQFILDNYNSKKEDFHLSYTQDLLKWSLDLDLDEYKIKKLDNINDWFLGVRTDKGVLVGVITAVPVFLKIQGKSVETAIVNHLCVKSELRSIGLAGFLIKELIRIVRVTNPKLLTSPIFTSSDLPFDKIVDVKMYSRYLNIDKLLEVNIIESKYKDDINFKKYYQNIEITKNLNISLMRDNDIETAYKLFKKNLKNYNLTIDFPSQKLFEDYYGNKFNSDDNPVGPIYTFVVKNDDNKVTDFISLYYLPYQDKNKKIILKPINILRIERSKTDLVDLLNYTFLITKEMGFDIFNCLGLFNISSDIKELKLDNSEQIMTYYTYNYNCGDVNPKNLGVIFP